MYNYTYINLTFFLNAIKYIINNIMRHLSDNLKS